MFELMALALSVTAPEAGPAGLMGGNTLWELCDDKDSLAKIACSAWVRGSLDMARIVQARSGVCELSIPDAVSLEQAQAVIVKWLRDNPAQRHLPAAVLALKALGEAFPCSRQ